MVVMAMTLRTDDELDRALTELARIEGTSKQEVVRTAVLEKLDRLGHEDRVRESAQRMIEKWGPVLDRLGSV
jgi:hypothetical protein